MKKILSLFLFILLLSKAAYASSLNTNDVFGHMGVSYNPVSVTSNGESNHMNGITLGGDIFKQLKGNFYLNFSPINAQLIFSNKKDYGVKTETFLISMKPSIGVAYRCVFDENGVYLVPNAGFDIGAYLGGSTYIGHDEQNLFKDMGYKRFIFDWHAGVQLFIKKISFIVKYEGGIAPIYNDNGIKVNVNQWHFGIAFDF